MNKRVLSVATIAALMMTGYQAHAAPAQATAKAKMKVVTAVAVNTVSDLIFNDAAAGEPAQSVTDVGQETPANASFTITGEANRAIIVTLPGDGVVKMATAGGGSSDNEIAVDSFISNNPATISGSGSSDLFVGATRAALSPTQTSGDYESDFVVEVAYQ
jgi:hypothetical protein